MAFPQVASVTPTIFATNITDHDCDLPATVNAGDLLILHYSHDSVTISAGPAGWTELQAPILSGQVRYAIYALVAAGTEGGGTARISSGGITTAVAHVVRITDWFGAIGGVEIGTAASGSGTATPDPPSLTASWGAEDNLFIALCGSADDDRSVSAYPTSYSSGVSSITGAGTDDGAGVGVAFRELAGATDDPATFTLDGNNGWVAQTIVVRPAAAAAAAHFVRSDSNSADSSATVDVATFDVGSTLGNRLLVAFGFNESTTSGSPISGIVLDPGGGDEAAFTAIELFTNGAGSNWVHCRAFLLKEASLPATGTYTIRATKPLSGTDIHLHVVLLEDMSQGDVVDTDSFEADAGDTTSGTVTTAADDAVLVNAVFNDIATNFTSGWYANGTLVEDTASGGTASTASTSYEERATAGGATVSAQAASTPAFQIMASLEFAAFVASGANDNRRGIARGVARGIARGI